MKNTIINCSILIALIYSGNVQAQTTSVEKSYGKVGAGVAFQPFSFASLLDEGSMVPVGGINLSFNLTEQFRLEADFGYMSVDNKFDEEKTSVLSTGIGFMFVKRREATAIMGGIKVDYLSGSNDFKGSMGTTYTNKITALSYGPILAFEHYMSKHFSVGGEVGLKARNFKEKADEDLNLTDDEYKVNSVFFHNAIYLRVYF